MEVGKKIGGKVAGGLLKMRPARLRGKGNLVRLNHSFKFSGLTRLRLCS